eukprot:2464215-Pleurochrysis_carterae.AAC.1
MVQVWGPSCSRGRTPYPVLVGEGECARLVQVNQHALIFLEQLVHLEGQGASQHANGLRDVEPGGHGNVKPAAAYNAPVASLAADGHVVSFHTHTYFRLVVSKGVWRSAVPRFLVYVQLFSKSERPFSR